MYLIVISVYQPYNLNYIHYNCPNCPFFTYTYNDFYFLFHSRQLDILFIL